MICDHFGERSNESNSFLIKLQMDCFAEPSSGAHFCAIRWLAMTAPIQYYADLRAMPIPLAFYQLRKTNK
jgi:hypothetical protein